MTSHLRRLHGFFGPKFQTGPGPFRVLVTGKVGFENFSVTNDNARGPASPTQSGSPAAPCDLRCILAEVSRRSSGPIGVRAEIGDDIYFLNGTHNNLRISLGLQFRFQQLHMILPIWRPFEAAICVSSPTHTGQNQVPFAESIGG
ncbi:MAG TPA: hypothetical protein VNO32_38570 [Candidatus Acidoferrum sp.]|nr:hypothetical protein [Candidatus Acidoferrum sp.]